jgi:uncharacterized protein YdhG (YjbR/CyaY superfamily)
MTDAKTKSSTVDDYLANVSPKMAPALKALRAAIQAAAPDAEEIMRMGAPTYLQHGNLVSFSATAKHCAFYVMSPGPIKKHREALKDFDTAPTAIRFQPDAPIADRLVSAIVQDRIQENMANKK